LNSLIAGQYGTTPDKVPAIDTILAAHYYEVQR